MKAFDLEAAKRGAAVCTRDGKQARIVCLDADNPLFSIVAWYEIPRLVKKHHNHIEMTGAGFRPIQSVVKT